MAEKEVSKSSKSTSDFVGKKRKYEGSNEEKTATNKKKVPWPWGSWDDVNYSTKGFEEALANGSLPVYYAGLMIVGYGGIGKSSLLRGLKNQPLEKVPASTKMARCDQSYWATQTKSFWKQVTEEEEYKEIARLIQICGLPEYWETSSAKSYKKDMLNLDDPHIREILAKVFRYASTSEPFGLKEDIRIRVWDCGGQQVFRTILPAFLTPKTMFFLCFDARHNLHDKCTSVYNHPECGPTVLDENLTVMQLLLKWMATIHASLTKENTKNSTTSNSDNCSTSTAKELFPSYPRVIIVGTHGDDESVLKMSREIADTITKACEGKSFAYLLDSVIIIDNTTAGKGEEEDPNYGIVRNKVVQFTKELARSTQTPIKWVLLRKVLDQVSAMKPVLGLHEFDEIAQICSIPSNQVMEVIQFYHDIGVIFHYSQISKLKDKVIINPQWLIHVIADLFPVSILDNRSYASLWGPYKKYGLLVQPLYEKILQKQDFLQPDEVMDLLSDFLIIAPIHIFSKKHSFPGKEYFVPGMLTSVNVSERKGSSDSKICSPVPLHLIFSTNYLPPGFFARLAASLSKHDMFEILFHGLSSSRITYAYGKQNERHEEITITENILSIQVDIECFTDKTSSAFYASCQEIIYQIQKCSKEVFQWLPQIEMKLALLCHQCMTSADHFINLPWSLTTNNPQLRCQNDTRIEIKSSERFWIDTLQENVSADFQHKNIKYNADDGKLSILETSPKFKTSQKETACQPDLIKDSIPDIPKDKIEGDKLEISDFILKKWKNDEGLSEKMHIMGEVAPKWKDIGGLLKVSNAQMKILEQQHLRDPKECCRDILSSWVEEGQGQDAYPATFSGLYRLLTDLEFNLLASKLLKYKENK